MRILLLAGLFVLAAAGAGSAANDQLLNRNSDDATSRTTDILGETRSLDGSGNNVDSPALGQANTQYSREAPANYADGVSSMVDGPDPRYISNRIFNDQSQNLFSENGVTQWAFVWGQFLDHTFGLREAEGGENAPIPFDASDPLEEFVNDMGVIDFSRSPAAPGSGEDSPREQLNTVSSYIDAWAVYGGSEDRLEWLREGPVDGDLSNNSAYLLLTEDGYLPDSGARGDVDAAPEMQLMGRLMGSPEDAVVAGDVRANENIALTAIHTLFAREHNRIVSALPADLPEETKFQIARAVVIAEQQYITYTEFLPALGIELNAYKGYNSEVDPSLSNEFAAAAFRAHSMIHGEFDIDAEATTYTAQELEALERQGVELAEEDGAMKLAVPLNVAFGKPASRFPSWAWRRSSAASAVSRSTRTTSRLTTSSGACSSRSRDRMSKTRASVSTARTCPTASASCSTSERSISSAGATTASRHTTTCARRTGWSAKESFMDITGESTEEFPDDPQIDAENPIDDPDILDFTRLVDGEGNRLEPGSDEAEEGAVEGRRRTTLAARLKAIYGDADNVDAFVGIVAEEHVEGSEFGELQAAIWKTQFEALRDGDRFFYENYPALQAILDNYGVGFQHSLAEVIARNTELDLDELPQDVFLTAAEEGSVQGGTEGGRAELT